MANRRRPRSRLHAVMRWGLLALLILFVYWDNTALRTDSLTYTSTALPAEFDGLRIVQLSDLHNREFGQNNAELYKAVENASPDVIFLTGDLVDEYAAEPVPYARSVGAALSAIAPTYYVTGNHEWAHGNAAVEELKTALRESGVTVLSNQFVPLERNGQTIFIAGIDDPNGYADQTTPEELAAKLAHGSRDALSEKTEWVLHSISCRAAIKAGDHTSPQELMALAEKILSGEVPPFCPHGRPCVLKLTRKELEKQFGRIV